MKRTIKTILLILLCTGQLAIIASMIIKVSYIKQSKITVLLECETYDPYDALRGRYLQVQLKSGIVNENRFKEFPSLKNLSEDKLQDLKGKEVYCIYGPSYNTREYRLEDIITGRPGKNFVFLKAKINSLSNGKLRLDMPAFKYYMQEDQALKADKILGRVDETIEALGLYIELEMDHDGNYIVKNVFIGEQSIEDYLNEH